MLRHKPRSEKNCIIFCKNNLMLNFVSIDFLFIFDNIIYIQ